MSRGITVTPPPPGPVPDGRRCRVSCRVVSCQPGSNLVAAGYCMYSSSTILVITLGNGVNGFTLDPQIGEFVLTHPNIRIPEKGKQPTHATARLGRRRRVVVVLTKTTK
jgi:hypothetical protein